MALYRRVHQSCVLLQNFLHTPQAEFLHFYHYILDILRYSLFRCILYFSLFVGRFCCSNKMDRILWLHLLDSIRYYLWSILQHLDQYWCRDSISDLCKGMPIGKIVSSPQMNSLINWLRLLSHLNLYPTLCSFSSCAYFCYVLWF